MVSVGDGSLDSEGSPSLKDMWTLMNPPSPAAPGLNISNHLSMGTASKISSTKIPAQGAFIEDNRLSSHMDLLTWSMVHVIDIFDSADHDLVGVYRADAAQHKN